MAGFEQWIDACQARKFHYFSTNDCGGLSRSAVERVNGVSSKYRQLNIVPPMVEQVSDMGRRAHVQ